MSKDGLRHYEELGLIASTPLAAGGRTYRDYDPSMLKAIEQIRQAQQLGFSLKEIGPLLVAHGSASLAAEQTVVFLEQRLTVIRQKRAELLDIESFIMAKLVRYREMIGS